MLKRLDIANDIMLEINFPEKPQKKSFQYSEHSDQAF